jgi:hypothetical protein
MAFTGGGLLGKGLRSATPSGRSAPTYIPEANQTARTFARISGGIPHNALLESVLNMSVIAHILGGCGIGSDPASGVIDSRHIEVYLPKLYKAGNTPYILNLTIIVRIACKMSFLWVDNYFVLGGDHASIFRYHPGLAHFNYA